MSPSCENRRGFLLYSIYMLITFKSRALVARENFTRYGILLDSQPPLKLKTKIFAELMLFILNLKR